LYAEIDDGEINGNNMGFQWAVVSESNGGGSRGRKYHGAGNIVARKKGEIGGRRSESTGR
jgi:hypothetical protein